MNIALLGAPGSGKSLLAEQLWEHLNKNAHTGIVDEYIYEIEKETNVHVGSIIDYVGNQIVILGRYGRENKARALYKNVITCGTLMESAIYYAAHIIAYRETSTPEEQATYAPRVDASLRMMGCYYQDLMPYDHMFYLRLAEGGEDAKFLDQQLQVAVAGFKMREIVPLDVSDDRCQKVLEVIGEVQES